MKVRVVAFPRSNLSQPRCTDFARLVFFIQAHRSFDCCIHEDPGDRRIIRGRLDYFVVRNCPMMIEIATILGDDDMTADPFTIFSAKLLR